MMETTILVMQLGFPEHAPQAWDRRLSLQPHSIFWTCCSCLTDVSQSFLCLIKLKVYVPKI